MRVVSLVPSLSEAVAVSRLGLLIGATDYCTHPEGLAVTRVGGSKYPDLDRVIALQPDLVLMNVEENRLSDAEALRRAGIEVHVTYPKTVDEALRELTELMDRLGLKPDWLADAEAAWAGLPEFRVRRAVIPVWRRPWVVLGSGTFAGDVLRRLGIENVYSDDPERYPRPTLAQIHETEADLVILPDEPYRFTASDGPESFAGTPHRLVSGRHLTWYGPSLAEAPAILARQLGVVSPA